jgi:hypothetical protein
MSTIGRPSKKTNHNLFDIRIHEVRADVSQRLLLYGIY